MKDLTTIKVWSSTRKQLKILAAELDKPMTEVADIAIKLLEKEKDEDSKKSGGGSVRATDGNRQSNK